MMDKIKKYLFIYKDIQLPWLLIFMWLIFSMVQTLTEVKTVTLTANIIDSTKNAIKINELIDYIIYLGASGLLTIAIVWISAKAQETINLRVRVKLWKKIIALPCKFYDTQSGDELVTRITNDAEAAREYFSLFISFIISVYGVFVVYRQLFAYHKTLAMWSMLVIPITIILGILYCVLGYKTGYMTNSALAMSIGYLADRVRNFKLIKSFNMEEKESLKANGIFKNQFKAESLTGLCLGIIQIVMQILSCAFLIISFVFGGQLVSVGEITIGKLIGFYSLSGVVGIRMLQFFMNMGAVASATGSLKKIAEIFQSDEEVSCGKTMEDGQFDIELENVSFSYLDNVPVLKNVNCVIPAKSMTAIIGTNGSGKSTIIKLLIRMYEASEGTIRFNGRDIAEYNIHEWRNKFSVVSQDNPLMSGTIKDNLLYGINREVSEEELIEVAKKANIYDLILSKEKGFDSEVDFNGMNFSGGQRQCLSIARAMLRNCEYLILDEVTSNLDAKCAKQVQEALNQLIQEKTVIMIAHTCLATACAGNIIVMKDGRIEDCGSPSDLIKRNAYYREFVKDKGESKDVCIE